MDVGEVRVQGSGFRVQDSGIGGLEKANVQVDPLNARELLTARIKVLEECRRHDSN